jgi:hypothetical protein
MDDSIKMDHIDKDRHSTEIDIARNKVENR